jgi:glycosyltransferase involved in cell wall biosynthesis
MSAAPVSYDVVIPTVGRPSLQRLLQALSRGRGPLPQRILVVDDRKHAPEPLLQGGFPAPIGKLVRVVRSYGRGPAAARNAGWRAGSAQWIAFVDDDVVPHAHWRARLAADIALLMPDVGGSQGRIRVPLPPDRKATDWERNVKALEGARWATADMAYRRDALQAVGGFDERFPRAFREDADLALRVMAAGYRLVCGRRWVLHPVRSADPWVSVRLQAGNADDALMRALHGDRWFASVQAERGRRTRHIAIAAAAAAGLAGAVSGNKRLAAAGTAAWLLGTAEFAWARIAPGPRTAAEMATMALTSVAIPPLAAYHWLSGMARARRLTAPGARLA